MLDATTAVPLLSHGRALGDEEEDGAGGGRPTCAMFAEAFVFAACSPPASHGTVQLSSSVLVDADEEGAGEVVDLEGIGESDGEGEEDDEDEQEGDEGGSGSSADEGEEGAQQRRADRQRRSLREVRRRTLRFPLLLAR